MSSQFLLRIFPPLSAWMVSLVIPFCLGEELFHASFDGTVSPEKSSLGNSPPKTTDVSFISGIKGKALVVGNKAFVSYSTNGNLRAKEGSISFFAKPIGWNGNDGRYHFFFFSQADSGDWIVVEKIPENLLAFIGGKKTNYSSAKLKMDDWKDGEWRCFCFTWENGNAAIYINGKLAAREKWPVVSDSFGKEFVLGNTLWGKCSGDQAIDELIIDDRQLTEKQVEELYINTIKDNPDFSDVVAKYYFVKQQEKLESDNLVKPYYDAVILPSSQTSSPETVVENVMDGKFETKWVSASGTFPNWVEVRWPQPVSVEKMIINEDIQNKTAEYRIDAYVENHWKTIVSKKTNLLKPGERIEEVFPKIETTKMRYYMLKPEGDPTQSASSITELQICGNAEWHSSNDTTFPPSWKSNWIWYPQGASNDTVRYFRKHFQIPDISKISQAWLQIGADDTYEVHINGKLVGSGGIPTTLYNVKEWLQSGENAIAVKCHQYGDFEGLIAELTLTDRDGYVDRIVTDQTWKSMDQDIPNWDSIHLDEKDWRASKEKGIPPNCTDHAAQEYFDQSTQEKFTIKSIQVLPMKVKTGSTAEIKFELEAPTIVKDDYSFLLRIGEKQISLGSDYTVASRSSLPSIGTSHWKPGKKEIISTKIYIPDWAPHGKIPIFLIPIGHGVEGRIENSDHGEVGSIDIQKFKTEPQEWPAGLRKTEIRYQNGHPTLLVDGESVSPFLMTENSSFSYQSFGEHSKAGIRIWRVMVQKGRNSRYYPQNPELEEQEYFAAIDQNIKSLLKVNPRALILVGTVFKVSQEWTDHNPNDATLLADGRRLQHSFSSRKWMENVKREANELVDHLANQSYSGHIIGLNFGIGLGPETYYWGMNANPYQTKRENLIVGDYSPEHIRAFREWLKEKYGNDTKALQVAWKDDKVNFESAGPDLDILRREDLLVFRDPAKTCMPLDYWEFHSDVMAQCVIDIGKTIKNASNGKLITGCWGLYSNGHSAQTNLPGRLQHGAFCGLQKVLESPFIDYLVMLQNYENTRWGTPMLPENLTESIRSHNKMCLIEYDMRTFFTPNWFASHTFSQQETLSVINRDILSAAIRGDGLWWVGFPSGNKGRLSVPWYSEDSIIQALKDGMKQYEAIYQQDLESVSEVAVFMNNADVYELDAMSGYKLLSSAQCNTLVHELTKIGAPFDLYHLDDVSLQKMGRYKVFIFLNAYNVNQKQRENLKKLAAKSGKTFLWVYAPGFCDGTKLSVENIKDLTGFQVAFDLVKKPLEMIIDGQHSFTSSLEANHRMKAPPLRFNSGDFEIGPVFYIDDPSAEILGRYSDNQKPAFASKKIGDNHSLYMAIPFLDSKIIKSVCRSAGVHLYSDEEIYLDATKHFLTITSTDHEFSGAIKLPTKSSVYDMLSKKDCGSGVDTFQVTVPPLTTALFFIEGIQKGEN